MWGDSRASAASVDRLVILRQREWTREELLVDDFRYYEAIKRLTMAHISQEAKTIPINLETLVAEVGDMICYDPGESLRPTLTDYEHWPVRSDLFAKNYRSWEEHGWQPTTPQKHLLEMGCRPYYKAVGIWAKRLRKSLYVESLESTAPILIPAGHWLCIGAHGEPYSMNDKNFRSRYHVPPDTFRDRLFWAAIALRYDDSKENTAKAYG